MKTSCMKPWIGFSRVRNALSSAGYELNPAGAAPKWAARIAGTPSTFNPARIFPAQEAVDSSDNPACPIQTTAACALDTPTWFRPGLTLTRLLREAELLGVAHFP